MPEKRTWEWPWENPNWIQASEDGKKKKDPDDDADEDGDTPKNTGSDGEKEPVKKPPQYVIESAEIIVPDEGLKRGLPFRFKGKARRLAGTAPSSARISVQALYRYKGKEQICGNPEEAEINKDSLLFEGEFDGLFEPDAYYFDKGKTGDAKYRLVLKLRGGCLDKDAFSTAVELPMPTQTYILKNGCYDATWTDSKKDAATYPESGEKYFPKDTVKKVQTLLIKLRFLETGNNTGYFGDLTGAAIKSFQETSQGQKRSKVKDDRIFYIPMNEITFKGKVDGVYGPETEQELAAWDRNNWVKPQFIAKKGDVDDNGVRNGHGERGADNYHEGEQIVEAQKALAKVDAYPWKLDGWFGPKMESSVAWLQTCGVKGEFISPTGQIVVLEEHERLKGHREKHFDEPTKKLTEKLGKKGMKVQENIAVSYSGSIAHIPDKAL